MAAGNWTEGVEGDITKGDKACSPPLICHNTVPETTGGN